ncbi:response regulator transcription factor [Ancylobacter mangrovi]|uniref:response regulator transcription factor n=1 Tax=Ancylobacter mangrovi TaxID=2972472 RepID=UPI00216290E2|nr:response regulator transcription factor [Ancylobacter mangrovi]MCS0501264.1 response regulator transcription factor [Ancylobacter mangrovi]
MRDCLSSSLTTADPRSDYLLFDSIQIWRKSGLVEQTSLVVFWANNLNSMSELKQQLSELRALSSGIPFAVMSDEERPAALNELIASGARAFLPTTLSLDAILKALYLVQRGGFFIPAQCLLSLPSGGVVNAPADLSELFSPRQLAVIKAMRKGMSNKVIAYELTMCESTVKVHVRNIMKKLKAKNRTEVAFVTQQMFPD